MVQKCENVLVLKKFTTLIHVFTIEQHDNHIVTKFGHELTDLKPGELSFLTSKFCTLLVIKSNAIVIL